MKKILTLAIFSLLILSTFSILPSQIKAEDFVNSSEAPEDYIPIVPEERLGNTEVLVIEDIIPWYTGYWPCNVDAIPAALETLGKTYDLIQSDRLATIDLTTYKIVILASTQGRSTYERINANIEKINAFVSAGGIYICHACDYGWGYPYEWSDWSSLQIMPGGVTHVTQYYSMYVHIVNPASPIVTGLDDAYFAGWGYATHGYFTDVPPDADVVMVTETPNKPTYIVYGYGSGKVLATMQTIEWGWGGVYNWVGGFRKEFLLNEIRYAQTLIAPVYIPSRIKVLMADGTVKPMDLEEYLRGVVYEEMGPDWLKTFGLNDEQALEALKAQAIAARTYAVARVLGIMWNPHRDTGAHVCTTECCQAWSSNSHPLSDQAVRDTRNIVATYKGKIIQAFYFAHCDGNTRTPLTAYPKPWLKDLPYCRSVECSCGEAEMAGHGVGMCQYGAIEMAKQCYKYRDILKHYYTDVEIVLAFTADQFNVAKLECPGELRVYDSENRVTGIMNGVIREEIPNSGYDDANKAVIIVFPADSYRYEVAGTCTGLYTLTVTSVTEEKTLTFGAIDIPTLANAIHQYTFDWDALYRGGEGVTVQIDSDGDGTFEQTITADGELTRDEFILQTATTIDFDPDTLNLKSKGTVVAVYIELPAGYDVSQIDVSSIMLNGTVPALAKPTKIGDYDGDGILDLMVKFDRASVMALFAGKTVPADYVIEVTGTWAGIRFKGTATITVISPP